MSVLTLKMNTTASITTPNMGFRYRKIICSLSDLSSRSIKPVFHGSRFLKKADNFRRAYDNFDIDKVASYGKLLASDAGQSETPGEILFLAAGDFYRNGMKQYDPNHVPEWAQGGYEWYFSPSSTIPYSGGLTLVGLTADSLLWIK